MNIQIKDNKIFAPLKDKWLVLKPEEEVRQRYICRLVESYGYDLKQMEQELKVTNLNFSLSCTQKSQISENKPQKYCRCLYL